MTSSQEHGTAAAAAEQLGSMSIAESAERKGNDAGKNEDAEEHGTPTKNMCSKCERKSDALKKCTACKCVWYCDKDCQNKHWKEHKKECRPIKKELDKRGGKLDLGTEEEVGPLGKLPPQEECPICMHTLPLHPKLTGYAACCGKNLCGGCNLQHQIKRGEEATCAFCRTAVPESEEQYLPLLSKRVKLKDPTALQHMAMAYRYGHYGLPVDQAKCVELMRQSADLGNPDAHFLLGSFYDKGKMGLERNDEEARKFWERAAEGGHLASLCNLGVRRGSNGDHVASMRHFRLCASGGYKSSMDNLISSFEFGLLHHGDLAETLQAFYRARAELKSEGRDQYIKYLKLAGEYREEYDL